MKYGSVCSGIEAASVAWESLGWQAQWYSEIEHFPSAVLAHRFPTVPNLGDMTQIHNTEHFNGTTIDLLVGGTPCQSFSVAGLRKGLDDTRGQLMLTFCELAARKRPRWVVWENVPGVLSSNKGEDLASFLGLLTGREIHPPVGGWKNSGVVEGIGSAYGVAWTVLDAQHFGVAQRRRRIFAVGYLGDWRPAAAVLFESYRLSGDIKEGRKKRKATSADAQGGSGGRGFRMTAFGEYADDNSASTLKQRDYKDATDLAVEAKPIGINGDVAGTLDANYYKGCGSANYGEREVVTHAFKVRGGSETETGEQGGTPGKKAGKGMTLGSDELAFTIGTTQDQQIAQPVPFRKARRAQSKDDYETWEQDEKTNTLNAFDTGDIRTTQAVVHHSKAAGFIPKNGAKARGIGYAEEQTPTLDTGCSNFGIVHSPIVYENHPSDSRVKEMGETCSTVTSKYGTGGGNTPLVAQPIAVDTYNQTTSSVNQTIKSPQGGLNESIGVVLTPIAVDTYNQTINEHSVQTIRSDGNHTDRTWAVLQPIAVDTYNYTTNEHTTQTIRSQNDTEHIGAVLTPPTIIDRAAFNQGQNAQYDIKIEEGETMPSLVARGPHGVATQNVSPTITQCKGSRGGSSMEALDEISAIHAQQPAMAIRRLTPTECERLQGFPDGHTLIPYRNKPAEQCPDGPRYKACGNSMAVPVMRWIGQRIQMVEDVMQEQNGRQVD